MLDQELPVFRVKRIVQMIPDIVCVQLLLCGIDLSVAVDDHVFGSLLPENLRRMAELRLEYPDISLRELGELSDPPMGKSGVNHRLRKLSEIAGRVKEQQSQ